MERYLPVRQYASMYLQHKYIWVIFGSAHRPVEGIIVFGLEEENEKFILKGSFLIFPCAFKYVNGFPVLKLHHVSGRSSAFFF